MEKFIYQHSSTNTLLHLPFHSYDFFTLKNGKIIIKKSAQATLAELLILLKKYNIPLLNFINIKNENFEPLDFKPPRLEFYFRSGMNILTRTFLRQEFF